MRMPLLVLGAAAAIALAACAPSSGPSGAADPAPSAATSTTSADGSATTSPQSPDGGQPDGHGDAGEAGAGFRLVSPAFAAGGAIPPRFTCDGEGVSPPLQWEDQPDGTQSLAIVVVDDDAPVPGGFTHWVLAGLDPPGGGIGEATTEGVAGTNSGGTSGWSPPCPPSGPHTYTFTVYAFDHAADFAGAPTRESVGSEPGLIATATLTGTYAATAQGDD